MLVVGVVLLSVRVLACGSRMVVRLILGFGSRRVVPDPRILRAVVSGPAMVTSRIRV